MFVSHATPDKWIARVMCEKVEAAGATTFRDDRDIEGGELIPREVFRQIRRSREFLVLLTPISVTRPWVLLETGSALSYGRIRIVPVTYHVGMDAIPAMIHQVKGFALNDFDQYLGELRARVEGGKP